MSIEYNPSENFFSAEEENKEKKKMPWQETMTKLENAVQDAQEKESNLNTVTVEFNLAKEEYSKAVALVETLRDELSNTVGQLFQSNPRVRVS